MGCKGCKGCKEQNNNCATNYAQCILYEVDLPEWSKIETSCVNLEDTTTELYGEVDKLREEVLLDLENCDILDYPKDIQGKTKVSEALPLISEALCNISKKPQEILLEELNTCLNWKKLKKVDGCGEEVKPSGICEILQRIINEIDALKP